jgi:membrane protease YdiL (CAAX protease family)
MINFDFLLWPMLIPMIIPLIYGIKYKRDSLTEIGVIIFIMIFIVIVYWPLTLGFSSLSNIIAKSILFVLVPLIFLYITFNIKNKTTKIKKDFSFNRFGITEKGFGKSLKLGFFYLPLMLIVTFLAKLMIGETSDASFLIGIISFIESFTEEFFFRGILFLFLLSKTNLKIAYITSLFSFVLMHPHNFYNPFIISTFVQGFLTIEISRRSKNLLGAWILHGTNRFFSIVIIPFFL